MPNKCMFYAGCFKNKGSKCLNVQNRLFFSHHPKNISCYALVTIAYQLRKDCILFNCHSASHATCGYCLFLQKLVEFCKNVRIS